MWRAALAVVVAAALLLWGAGDVLTRPATRAIGPAPADLAAQSVRLPIGVAGSVAGWFVPGRPGQGVVVVLHGVRADRRQMLARARFLGREGYATLLIDLPAHGESSGDRITFGAREAAGVQAALAYLRRAWPGERVGVIGVSLGAAAAVLARPSPAPDAVVLESMYPTIEEAAADRVTQRLGRWSTGLAQPLLWLLPLQAGVRTDQLRPIDRIGGLAAPVLVASGAEDRHTRWNETLRIFEAAAEPRELWRVDGVAHVDLHAARPAQYEAKILAFLGRFLRPPG